MPNDDDTVQITATNFAAAIPLAQPVPDGSSPWYKVTTLEFMAEKPSRFGRMFKGGDGITVNVDPSPVAGGALQWSTQVSFPKGTDFARDFSRTGLEWPVWWAIPEMTHLVEKVRILEFVAFAPPELALPWFVRLHAAATGVDALAPVVVVRDLKAPLRPGHDDLDDLDEIIRDVRESGDSDDRKADAYAEWQARAAQQRS